MEKDKSSKIPSWIQEFKRRTMIIDVFAMAYENDCDCSVCQKLREICEDMGQWFIGSGVEQMTSPKFRR